MPAGRITFLVFVLVNEVHKDTRDIRHCRKERKGKKKGEEKTRDQLLLNIALHNLVTRRSLGPTSFISQLQM